MLRVLAVLAFLGVLALGGASGAPARADGPGPVPAPVTLDPPEPGPAVLSIKGPSGETSLTLAGLEALGVHRVAATTFWPDDDGVYEGPLLSDVLRHAGLDDAPAIRVSAVDGFSQVIPREDWTRWPVMLATRRDGRVQSVRQKGPVRIIYPRDMDRALSDTVYRLRWVWLVQAIEPAVP